ncbi:MAG: TetR/AcrR family transcriptional regulator [Ilumatobacteraceae bacterium]
MVGVRERARTELTAQIKRTARRHLAREGAAGLSLRAVARDLGMVSSAVYRYFPSRDDLLTALIIDAYEAFGAAAERAEAAIARDDLLGRWRAAGAAAYSWSGKHAAEYALIFGSPVPGYRAPDDTIGPAGRFTGVLLGILSDADQAGLRPHDIPPLGAATRADIEQLRARIDVDIDADWLAAGLRAWTSLIGLISFIRFGHLHNVVLDEDAYFADTLDRLGRSVIAV